MTAYVIMPGAHRCRCSISLWVRIQRFAPNSSAARCSGWGSEPVAFLLPLLLQLRLQLHPARIGARHIHPAAVGAFTMKTFAARIIRRFGFRRILIANALLSSVFTAACGLFTPQTPFGVMIAVLLIGGFFRSLQFTATNTIAYADVDATADQPRRPRW